jgi:hypothetical protein
MDTFSFVAACCRAQANFCFFLGAIADHKYLKIKKGEPLRVRQANKKKNIDKKIL